MAFNVTEPMTVSMKDVSYCQMDITGQLSPDLLEIGGPPLLIGVVLFIGLVGLNIQMKRQSKKIGVKFRKKMTLDGISMDDIKPDRQDEVKELMGDPNDFLTDFDREVMHRLSFDYNKAKSLIAICLPSVVVLIMATVTVVMRNAIYSCVWPHRERASMNTALTCFLAPAGLTFALSFGFVFALVLEKHASVYETVANELSWLDQMLTMTTKFNWSCKQNAMAVMKAIKSELVIIGTLVMNKEPTDIKRSVSKNVKVHIWTILDVLQKEADHHETGFNLNSVLVEKMVDYLIHVNSICTDRMGALHMGIHPLKWLFLEILASVTIFGILLVDASSTKAEIALCQLTTLSIAMLFYLLADFDAPFDGFFRVTTAIIPEVVDRADSLYRTQLCELRLEEAKAEMEESLVEKGQTKKKKTFSKVDRETQQSYC